jgi:branched-chain amino acid transport system permease protein
VAFVGLEDLLSGWTEHWQIIFGPMVTFVILFLRGGLLSLLPARRRKSWASGRG